MFDKANWWGEIHRAVFNLYTELLREKNISFFILRNYRALPEINHSKDVDFVIDPAYFDEAFYILLIVFKETGFSHYSIKKLSHVNCCFAMCLDHKAAIEIDLLKGCYIKGVELFPFKFLKRKIIPYKNFFVVQESLEAVLLILFKIIRYKKIKESYITEINNSLTKNPDEIKHIFSKSLGEKYANLSMTYLNSSDYKSLFNISHKITFSYQLKSFLNKPVKTFINITKFRSNQLGNLVKPSKFIAVEGPDGVGKTMFINGLIKAISFYFVSDESKSDVIHFRPTLLPNLGAIGESVGVMKENKEFTNPHRAKPASKFSSLIRMLYYWIDYLIGVPLLKRKGAYYDQFIIFDRYIYDFLIDPHRSRINLPFGLRKMFTKMVAQPTIVFVLMTDAETIFKRKQELTIDEINRQLVEFTKLTESDKRFVPVDATLSPEEMVNFAIKVILDHFSEKLA